MEADEPVDEIYTYSSPNHTLYWIRGNLLSSLQTEADS